MTGRVPQFVYIKYQCPRCAVIAQELLEFYTWDAAILDPPPPELTEEERERFVGLGAISLAEMARFGIWLRTAGAAALEALAGEA